MPTKSLSVSSTFFLIEGISSSFPCTCENGEYKIVQGLEIDDYSRGKIDASAGELVEERDAVRELGLI